MKYVESAVNRSEERGADMAGRLDDLLLANTNELIAVTKDCVQRAEPQFALLKQMHQAKVLRQELRAYTLKKRLFQIVYSKLTTREIELIEQHRVFNALLKEKLKHFLLERIFLLY